MEAPILFSPYFEMYVCILTKEILEQYQNKGKWIPQLPKITFLFPDWWRSLNQKKG